MKSLSIFILSCFTGLSVWAQNNITVNVTVNGNVNREVLIDGKTYLLSDYQNTSTGNNKVITISDLQPGQHTLQVVRNNASNSRRSVGSEKIFNLRSGYDLDIVVNGNGTIQQTEKRVRNRNRDNRTTIGTPMTSTNFNTLYQDIRRRGTNSARATLVNTAISNPSNYFTTAQVSQLVQLVSGEGNRLALLKTSYRSVVDPANFSSLYPLLTTQAARNDLGAYVTAYTPAGNTGVTTGYKTAMSTYNFNALVNDVRNEYNNDNRVNAIYNAFSAAGNFFSTDQVRRLIQLITGEANMLHLAKASYRAVVDPQNFTAVYNLLPTQASRNDLAAYVNSYNPNVMYSGTVTGSTTFKAPMNDVTFNTMLSDISKQWLPGAKKTAVINAFTTANNYFSTSQAIQLIQLDNDEPDRLDMAKASYRAIVDPANFTQVYSLFSSQAYRDDLANYVRNYNPNTTTTTTTTTYGTAMSDANFNILIDDIRKQWLPGAKKSAVINAFSTGNNYFTTSQALQLIQLDNDEPDRLDMAKASYRVIVDRNNFAQVYNLFTTQSYRDDLAAYVNAYR